MGAEALGAGVAAAQPTTVRAPAATDEHGEITGRPLHTARLQTGWHGYNTVARPYLQLRAWAATIR